MSWNNPYYSKKKKSIIYREVVAMLWQYILILLFSTLKVL